MNALPQLTEPELSPTPVTHATPEAPAERRDQTPTLVGHGTEFAGQLHCPGDLTVAGHGQGVAHVGGTFVLSQHASWRGELYCSHAVVAGTFTGQLHVKTQLDVHASGKLYGDLHTANMTIAPGAVVAANLYMDSKQ